MTLREIVAAFPDLFYATNGIWWQDEPFMARQPRPISEFFWTSEVQLDNGRPVHAVDLAAFYVKHPDREVWRNFLWTDDVDQWGNRVYVGGVGQYGIEAFQIHRRLEPLAYWVGAA